MSTDFMLTCDCCGNILHMDESIQEGGTQVMGGTTECSLNVTYNYAPLGLNRALLEGKTGTETMVSLKELVDQLGTDRNENTYWEPSEGNVGFAADILHGFAVAHPNGVWKAY